MTEPHVPGHHSPRRTEQLHYPFAAAPLPAEPMHIAAGVYWLRLPLPFALDHINVWLLEDGDGWALVDTGCATEQTRAIWEDAPATFLGGRPIHRIIITHHHPDHIGMAEWLARANNAEVWMHPSELTEAMYIYDGGAAANVDRAARVYRQYGLEADDALLTVCEGHGYNRLIDDLPRHAKALHEGEHLSIGGQRWNVRMTSGHSPGHLCLFNPAAGLAITGDQLLPTITTNVSVFPRDPDENPLQDFLASMDLFGALDKTALVLPSHGRVFVDAPRRARQLQQHHERTLEQTVTLCADPITANEVCASLFPYVRAPLDLMLAMGEAVAHLNYLMFEGSVRRELVAGVYRYHALG